MHNFGGIWISIAVQIGTASTNTATMGKRARTLVPAEAPSAHRLR